MPTVRYITSSILHSQYSPAQKQRGHIEERENDCKSQRTETPDVR